MKRFDKKYLGFAFAMIALCLGATTSGYADQISVWPDSVTMSAAIGTSTQMQINVWATNIDTLGDTLALQQGTALVRVTGSSQFRLLSDSVLRFQYNYGQITVQYSPTGAGESQATLTIVGDSNTVTVKLIGNPIDHSAPTIQVAEYQNLEPNQQTCHPFEIYNTNADSIQIQHITLSSSSMDSGWALENGVSLPVGIAGHGSDTMGDLCALASIPDTFITGNLTVVYSYANQYGSGVDSTSVSIEAWHRPINATCVTTSGANFGTLAEGASVTKLVTFTNTTDSSIYLDSPQITGGSYFTSAFTFNASQFPLTIAAGASANVNVTFSAPSVTTQDNYDAYLTAQVHGTSPDGVSCNSVSAYLTAAVPIPAVDSLTLDVPPGSSNFSISARTDQSRHAIFIRNDGTNPIQLSSLTVSSADSNILDSVWAFFGSSYDRTQYLSDTVAPGETVGPILLILRAADTGTYDLSLTLTYVVQQAYQKGATPASSNTVTYTVTAHRLPPLSAGVSEPNVPQPVEFTLSPNPAQGEVTIGLPEDGTSKVEIYDVLGNLVLHRTTEGSFTWNGALNGSPAANGAYIVRVSHGNQVSSKRLVFVR